MKKLYYILLTFHYMILVLKVREKYAGGLNMEETFYNIDRKFLYLMSWQLWLRCLLYKYLFAILYSSILL